MAAGGAKAAERAGKALTGDVYTRSWTSVVGKGKTKKVVDHTLHVNPLTLAIGTMFAGGALALGAIGLWATQRKLDSKVGGDFIRILDFYEATYKTVTEKVLIADGFYQTTYINGVPKEMWVPAIYDTVTTTVVDIPARWTLSNSYGVPVARGEGFPDLNTIITRREQSLGYVYAGDAKLVQIAPGHARKWMKYHSDTDKKLALGTREGFGIDIG